VLWKRANLTIVHRRGFYCFEAYRRELAGSIGADLGVSFVERGMMDKIALASAALQE
jgi:hypothetical protein